MYLCVLCGSQNTPIISLHSISSPVCITVQFPLPTIPFIYLLQIFYSSSVFLLIRVSFIVQPARGCRQTATRRCTWLAAQNPFKIPTFWYASPCMPIAYIARGGRDSSVGIATRYVVEGPGIESWWGGRDFPHPSRPTLGPTQPHIQQVPGLSCGVKRRGPHPHVQFRGLKYCRAIPLPTLRVLVVCKGGAFNLYIARVFEVTVLRTKYLYILLVVHWDDFNYRFRAFIDMALF